MKIRASAPAKIILCGEHFVVYGTKAVLCAIDRRITVTAERLPGRPVISIRSAIAGPLDEPPGRPPGEICPELRPLYYLADRMMAGGGGGGPDCDNDKNDNKGKSRGANGCSSGAGRRHNDGIRVTVESEIPPGAGLGSSSACCVAAAAAIFGLSGAGASREQVLSLAIDAERTIFAGTSGADCTVCTYGGLIKYDGAQPGGSFARLGGLDPRLRLVVADSGAPHSTEQMARAVRTYRQDDAERFSRMCGDVSRLVDGVLALISDNGSIADLGRMMTSNQGYLKQIGVSNDALDALARAGRESSLGAKITGAGGGGCVFALCEQQGTDRAMRGFEDAGCRRCFVAGIDGDGLILYN